MFKVVYFMLFISAVTTKIPDLSSFNLNPNAWRGAPLISACVVPDLPPHGSYQVTGTHIHDKSSSYMNFYLYTSCEEGYKLSGKNIVLCSNGIFSDPLPTCVPITTPNIRSGSEANETQSNGTAYCAVPPRPLHGSFEVNGTPIQPGRNAYQSFYLVTKCDQGYRLKGKPLVMCADGVLSNAISTCVLDAGSYTFDQDVGIATSSAKPWPKCVTPRLTEGIHFLVNSKDQDRPGGEYDNILLVSYCNSGYKLQGPEMIFCVKGVWSNNVPRCQRMCRLKRDKSVNLYCQTPEGTVLCEEYIPPGTQVTPECKDKYTYEGTIPKMTCGTEGYFDYVVSCVPAGNVTECGLSSVNRPLVVGGVRAEHGEVPWHAGIYTKSTSPYMQICGGSIITNTYIITAAHCFWYGNDRQAPSEFDVVVGKIYRPWNEPNDIYVQKSDVLDIRIPILYFGSQGNYQNDIALVKLATAIQFNRFAMPVCLRFSEDLNSGQLQDGNLGRVAGWGLMSNGYPSPVLNTVRLPFVNLGKCVNESPPNFKPYITSDKICAGYTNGTALCAGDSGGGLVFHKTEDGVTRYYLQGVVSTAPSGGVEQCNTYTWTTFTHVYRQREFLLLYVST